MKIIKSAHEMALKVTTKLKWLPPLLGRVTLGGVFIESGWGKIHNITKVVGYFTELGLPLPEFQAHLVAYTEFLCGSALLIGLFTRLAAIPIVATMTVAILTAKRTELQSVTDIFGFSEFLYIVISVWLIIEGPGQISIDYYLKKYFSGKAK
jgi:putative oxidoreductase